VTKEQKIEYVLKNMDWGKIHKVMEFMNWTWGEKAVPTHYELIDEGRRLLNYAANSGHENFIITTGGLKVTKCEEDYLLEFVLENSESFWGEEENENA
jgi:hypothetical protein